MSNCPVLCSKVLFQFQVRIFLLQRIKVQKLDQNALASKFWCPLQNKLEEEHRISYPSGPNNDITYSIIERT